MIPACSQAARQGVQCNNRHTNAPPPPPPACQKGINSKTRANDNRPFLRYFLPLLQNLEQKLLYDNQLKLLPVYMKNENVGGTRFHINGFALILFATEAKDNSEMADCTFKVTDYEEHVTYRR